MVDTSIEKSGIEPAKREACLDALRNVLGSYNLEGLIVYRNGDKLDLGVYKPCGNCLAELYRARRPV